MQGVFQDIEAAGQERRYERLRLAKGLAVVLIAPTLFVFRDIGMFLVAVYAVVIPVFLVVDSWLGLAAREPPVTLTRYLRARAGELATLLIAFAVGMFWGRPFETIPWGVASIVLAAAAVFVVRAIYLWRERYRPTNYGLTGVAAADTLLSPQAVRIHFAGYAIGLAAALTAAAATGDPLAASAAYFTAFVAGKLAADMIWPLPASLASGPASRTLAKMTAVSPVLWGAPWGIAAGGGYFLWTLSFQPQYVTSAAQAGAWVSLSVAVAVPLVFALLTAIAYGHEVLAGLETEPNDTDDAAARSWAVHYWAVLGIALLALAVLIDPMAPRDEEVFGEETWTCAKQSSEYELVWIGKAGVRISFRRHHIDLFNVSCVPRADGRGCDYDDEGWHEITIVVAQDGRTAAPIIFNRTSPGVHADLRHHADIDGELADAIVGAFRAGRSAKITVRAKGGRLLYEKTIDLRGFLEGQNACQLRWG
jgi:hypothetical protein